MSGAPAPFDGRRAATLVRTGSLWLLAARGSSDLVRLLRTVLIARLTAPSAIGTVAAGLFVTSCAEALTEMGLQSSVTRLAEKDPKVIGSLMRIQIVRAAGITLVLWGAAPWCARFFEIPALTWTIRALCLTIVAKALTNPAVGLIARNFQFRTLAVWNTLDSVVALLFVAATLPFLDPVLSITGSIAAGQIAKAIVSFFIVPVRPQFGGRADLGSHLPFAQWMIGSQMATFLSLQIDNFSVAKLFGAHQLGLYQTAFRISELPALVSSAIIAQAAYPVFSALRDDGPTLHAAFWRLQRQTAALTVGFALAIGVASPVLVSPVFGSAWAPVTAFLPPLLVAAVLRASLALTGWFLLAVGNVRMNFALNACRVAGFCLVVWPLAGAYGALGISFSVLAGTAAALPIALYAVRAERPRALVDVPAV